MPKLSIIIPSYNTSSVTKKCLFSLLQNIKKDDPDFEIIVVDNASTDGSQTQISNLKTQNQNLNLKTIFNKKNLGFGKANNQGIKIAKGEYILFLNSDVIVKKINFRRILDYLDRRPEVGGFTVKVILPNRKIDPASHRGFPTLWNSFCYFFKLEKIFGDLPLLNRIFGGYHLTYLDLRTIHEIDSPSGAFFLVRKKILDQIGGFDEDYFMYGEDIDLSYRIKKAGYKIIYYPFYQVIHLKYASGLKTKDLQVRSKIKRHFYEAMKIFYKKHYEKKYPGFINWIVYTFIDLKIRFL